MGNSEVSAGADALLKEWSKAESKMRAAGKSEQDITLAKSDFFSYIGTTLIMSIQFDKTLTDAEKKVKLQEILTLLPKDSIKITNKDCPYTEEQLPLQEMFKGATIKFSKPMLYLEWDDPEEKGCTPIRASAKYLLESTASWASTIFDKSKIKETPIDPNTIFTVESRILVSRGGLFSNKSEYYVFRDSSGVVTVPFYLVFDPDRLPPQSGSDLYRDGKYVGHIVSDLKTKILWIEGTTAPAEVKVAHEVKRQTNFETSIDRRSEYLRRVMFAVDEGKFKDYTVAESIALGHAENIYQVRNGKIVADYGGDIEIVREGSDVSVTFKGIPRGDKCHEFYFMNDPSIFGFTETYIDGVLETYPEYNSTSMKAFDTKVCFSNKPTSDIKFKGSISKIQQQAGFTRRVETSPYAK